MKGPTDLAKAGAIVAQNMQKQGHNTPPISSTYLGDLACEKTAMQRCFEARRELCAKRSGSCAPLKIAEAMGLVHGASSCQ